jgi:hypothetical protein
MADPMKVVLKITSVKGTCTAGHKVGEEFDLSKDFVLGYSGKWGENKPQPVYRKKPVYLTRSGQTGVAASGFINLTE